MKKLLAIAILSVAILAGGCKKVDTEQTNYIGYLGSIIYINTVSFIENENGSGTVYIECGSRSAYENQEIETASYIGLTIFLENADTDFQGEYNIGSGGHIEYKAKGTNPNTGLPVTDEWNHSLLSGTIKITQVEGIRYKVSFSGNTFAGTDILPITAEVNGNVKIVRPDED